MKSLHQVVSPSEHLITGLSALEMADPPGQATQLPQLDVEPREWITDAPPHSHQLVGGSVGPLAPVAR